MSTGTATISAFILFSSDLNIGSYVSFTFTSGSGSTFCEGKIAAELYGDQTLTERYYLVDILACDDWNILPFGEQRIRVQSSILTEIPPIETDF